jgi:heme-degrading monooxygenase HmoA
MDLPWSAAGTPPAGQDAYVMASRFELTSIWRSPAFLTQAVRAWRQARRSPGVYGVTLRAELLQRRYWTLSAWTGEAALREFARAEPHRTIIRRDGAGRPAHAQPAVARGRAPDKRPGVRDAADRQA